MVREIIKFTPSAILILFSEISGLNKHITEEQVKYSENNAIYHYVKNNNRNLLPYLKTIDIRINNFKLFLVIEKLNSIKMLKRLLNYDFITYRYNVHGDKLFDYFDYNTNSGYCHELLWFIESRCYLYYSEIWLKMYQKAIYSKNINILMFIKKMELETLKILPRCVEKHKPKSYVYIYASSKKYIVCENLVFAFSSSDEPDESDELKAKIKNIELVQNEIASMRKQVFAYAMEKYKLYIKDYARVLEEELNEEIRAILNVVQWFRDEFGFDCC